MIPLNEMIEAANQPATRHAIVVHLPIALSVLGVVLALMTAIMGRFNKTLRWVTLAAYVLLAVTAWVATETGEDAEKLVPGDSLRDQAYQTLQLHEERAEWVWPMALIIAAIFGLSAIPSNRSRPILAWLGVLGSVGVVTWIGYVGHLGGVLVYEHGVGTPNPVLKETEPAPPPASTDDDAEPVAVVSSDPRVVFYLEHVQPVLETNCYRCHNSGRPRSGLDQTTIAGLLKGGHGGPAVVPGDPQGSLLMQSIEYEDELLQMPPDGKLEDADIANIRKWIADGAVWPE